MGKGHAFLPFSWMQCLPHLSDQFSKGYYHNSSHSPPSNLGWAALGLAWTRWMWQKWWCMASEAHKRQCDSGLGIWPVTLSHAYQKAAACLESFLVEEVTLGTGWPHGGALRQLEEGEKAGQLLAPPGLGWAAIDCNPLEPPNQNHPTVLCRFLVPRNLIWDLMCLLDILSH